MGGEGIGHLLVGEVGLVVGEQWAAVDFLPAVLAGEPVGVLGAGDGVAGSRRRGH